MKGFIFELFGTDDSNSRNVTDYEWELVEVEDRGLFHMQYINPNIKNYSIGFKRNPNNDYMSLNVSILIGLLTETYIRWIGYDHLNDEILMDGLNMDYQSILNDSQYLLQNSKRILLHYDYVLPLDNSKYFDTNSEIWQYIKNELAVRLLNITNNVQYKWSHARQQSLNNNDMISTRNLFNLWTQTGELQLLIKHNTLDMELFEFAKQIASIDMQFIQQII